MSPKDDRIAIEPHRTKKVVTTTDEFVDALIGDEALVEEEERAASKNGPGRKQTHVLTIAGNHEGVERQQAVYGHSEHEFERGLHVTGALVEGTKCVSDLDRTAVPSDDVWESACERVVGFSRLIQPGLDSLSEGALEQHDRRCGLEPKMNGPRCEPLA